MKYFYKLLDLIRDGKPISNEVREALDRVPHYIATYKYNKKYVSALISFIEHNMWLQKGGEGKLKLQTEQKFWIEMMGFEYDDGRPVITDLPVIIGAGSGKSTFLAALSLAVMIVGSKRGQDILVFANSKKQAQELFRTSSEICSDERSSLYEFYKRDLLKPIINQIKYAPTNSIMQIKAMDNHTADGVNVRMVVFDEFHAYTTNVIENIRKSTAPKRKKTGYTIFYSSTNGQTRGAVFDSYMIKWEKILTGEVKDDSIFPIIYKMDDVKEVLKPELYEKALPFIKELSDPMIIYDLVKKAKGNPVAQAEILAKSFNIPQELYNSLFTSDIIERSLKGYKPIPDGATVYVGYDLSSVYDLSAIVFVYKDEEHDNYYIYGHAFIPRDTYNNKISRELKERYTEYAARGYLTLVDTPTIESSQVYNYMDNFIKEHQFTVVNILGDAFYNKEYRKLINDNYGDDVLVIVRQNVRELSEPLKYIQAYINSNKLFISNDLLAWNFANLRVKVDANNNIFPNKQKARAQIDLVSASISAFNGILNADNDSIVSFNY